MFKKFCSKNTILCLELHFKITENVVFCYSWSSKIFLECILCDSLCYVEVNVKLKNMSSNYTLLKRQIVYILYDSIWQTLKIIVYHLPLKAWCYTHQVIYVKLFSSLIFFMRWTSMYLNVFYLYKRLIICYPLMSY